MFYKKGIENICARVSLRTFFTEHLWTTASQNTETTLLAFHVMLTFSFKLVDAIDNKRVDQAWKQLQ